MTQPAAYVYQADLHCPACIRHTAAALANLTLGDTFTPEETLDTAARAMGIDRYDERSYDSDDFPKVAFANQLNEESLDHCGQCGDCLAHDLSRHPDDTETE